MPALRQSRAALQRALHGWYRDQARPLPWRTSPSLYKTVLSEFMLQQTQVATVLPYFERWVAALPDFASLATASGEKVMQLWAGLGYYSRARNLHRLAQALHARTRPPQTPDEWRELPGVGPYTAAAIASIAHGHPTACVDGNVVRVLARLTDERREFRDNSEASAFFRPLAESLLEGSDPGEHNQAMMELGALVCVRARPKCEVCPVAAFCAARKQGDPAAVPVLRPKRYEAREIDRAWCVNRGRVLLHRTGESSRRLAGLSELPLLSAVGGNARGKPVLERRRSVTRFRILESIFAVAADAKLRLTVRRHPELFWAPLSDIESVALSGPHRRWIAELVAITKRRRA